MEIRISQLGNHYVRVEKWLENADVHDLNQMMRRSAKQMGNEGVTFDPTADGVDPDTVAGSCRERLSEFARALIEDLSENLKASVPTRSVSISR